MAEKHPKRPRDPNQLAKLVVDIATGQEVEPLAKTSSAELKSPLVPGRPRKDPEQDG